MVSFALLLLFMLRLQPVSIEKPPEQIRFSINEIHTNYAVAGWEKGKLLLYDAQDYGLDDVIEGNISCEAINAQKNFGLFDFTAYMNKRHVKYACHLKNGLLQASGNTPRAMLYRHVNHYEEEMQKWLKLTLYHIGEDEENKLELIGSTGMHLILLLQGVTSLCTLWVSKRKANGICLMIITAIASITAWRDSLLRMFCFRLISFLLPHYDQSDRLGIAVLLLLLIRPYLAAELVFVLPFLFRFLALFKSERFPRLCFTFAILLPLQFYYFHEVDMLSLLLFGVIRFFYALNYGCALLSLVLPFTFLFSVAQHMLAYVQALEAFHIAFYYQASTVFVWLWLALLLRYFRTQSLKVLGALGCMLLYTQLAPYLRPYAQVLMIDVGQGDCTLISLPYHQGNILIDVAGSDTRDIPQDIIVPALHAQGITSLDIVIITHDDMDHSGGLKRLQQLMEVKQVIRTKQDDVDIGDFRLQFLLSDTVLTDRNENSIITYFDAYDTSFLFMGDAGKQAERLLIKRYPNLKADILKVGHHGSKSASSPAFLQSLHPTIGLISCGAHNYYGHPHAEVLSALAKAQVNVLDTPHKGAVSIKISNIFCIYKTAAHDFGIINNR